MEFIIKLIALGFIISGIVYQVNIYKDTLHPYDKYQNTKFTQEEFKKHMEIASEEVNIQLDMAKLDLKNKDQVNAMNERINKLNEMKK